MGFSNKKAKKELSNQHELELPILLAHGITAEESGELFRCDEDTRKSNRRYYRHILPVTEQDVNAFSVPDNADSALSILDQIENERLHDALTALMSIEREIVVQHVIEGIPLKEIAVSLGKTYFSAQRQYHRAIQKIKKFLK